MIMKKLEKKVNLVLDEANNEQKDPIQLEYYLLESYMDECCELAGQKVYGVEVVKKMDLFNCESESVRNLSCCKESVNKILDRLAHNSVTPIGLPFILDDLIGV